MSLLGSKEMLTKAYAEGYAVGGFDGYDSISILAAIEESVARRSPIMMICAAAEYAALGANGVAAVARALSDMAGVGVCLHLDHGKSFAEVEEAIAGGFSSVMIDGSALDFEGNVAITRKVVDYAHARGIAVEAELGAVGRVDDDTHEGKEHAANIYTDPGQAREFVERTGCDYLAVSIGNAHGLYHSAPSLDFDCLAKIRGAVAVPLVLHGGSGTPEDQLRRAVSLGIAKVNVASEIGQAFTTTYIRETQENKIWWAVAKNECKLSMRQVIGKWIGWLGSSGKA